MRNKVCVKLSKGFTIVEVLVALLIISTVTLALVQLQGVSFAQTGNARDQLVASQIVFEVVDTINYLERSNTTGNIVSTYNYPSILTGTSGSSCDLTQPLTNINNFGECVRLRSATLLKDSTLTVTAVGATATIRLTWQDKTFGRTREFVATVSI
ncbi:MAG: prepilin-type N-terminal cleavage/methylation domain-containing protein [Methylacidiphilales bacterium]|nr:prepilin-type N-terminal cleavage/methylation domain-containing protein [Candidatus Methylacidiphilales bacterium]